MLVLLYGIRFTHVGTMWSSDRFSKFDVMGWHDSSWSSWKEHMHTKSTQLGNHVIHCLVPKLYQMHVHAILTYHTSTCDTHMPCAHVQPSMHGSSNIEYWNLHIQHSLFLIVVHPSYLMICSFVSCIGISIMKFLQYASLWNYCKDIRWSFIVVVIPITPLHQFNLMLLSQSWILVCTPSY